MPPINKVNGLLAESVKKLEKSFPGRVAYVNCGAPFDQSNGTEEVPLALMPDRLHPNAAGHRLMADCLGDAMAKLDSRKLPP